MVDYMFKVGEKNGLVTKIFNEIENDSNEYISYNDFLNNMYGTDIVENEDYIPLLTSNDEVIMILAEDKFDITDLENVFEVMCDTLYGAENEYYEENCGC